MSAPFSVLFLCAGNSGRGIMAEALLNHFGKGLFKGYSVCCSPTGQVHPLALSLLEEHGVSTKDLCTKSWDDFAKLDVPAMNFVFKICDQAAAEDCPTWSGQPIAACRGIPNPATVRGTEFATMLAFHKVRQMLVTRIKLFLILRSPHLIAWL